jgi:hypothetical protein
MKTKLLIALISTTFTGWLQAQINVGVNYINGVNSSAHSGTLNTNDASNSSVGGYGNAILTNTSSAFIGGGSYNVAAGLAATIAGGYDNFTTNALSTIGGGIGNTISANAATIPGGAYAVANHFGQLAYSSQKLSVPGDSQASLFTLRNSSTSTNPTELSLSVGTPVSAVGRMTLGSGAVWSFRALVSAKDSSGNAGGWEFNGVIKNVGGTTTMVGVSKNDLGKDVATWDVSVVADDVNDSLVIHVIGSATSTVKWTAAVNTSELN